jgi:hypothetical protein
VGGYFAFLHGGKEGGVGVYIFMVDEERGMSEERNYHLKKRYGDGENIPSHNGPCGPKSD